MANSRIKSGYAFTTLDVFTSRAFCGNPLAVVWDADALTTRQMQAIASEFGYSETSFVLAPRTAHHEARLRIFTPSFEIDFAGHPTIGTAIALAQRRSLDMPRQMTLEENAGDVVVSFTQDGYDLVAAFEPPVKPMIVADLSIDGRDTIGLEGCFSAHVATAGTPFAFVELVDMNVVDACVPGDALVTLLEAISATGLFVFTKTPQSGIYARMFAPDIGVLEDPATGSAVAALAAVLWQANPKSLTYKVTQGAKMGRLSTIGLDLVGSGNHGLDKAYVSGTAVEMMSGKLREIDGSESTEA